jgi:hypothetical protein
MRYLAFVLILLGASAAAHAQTAPPDLRGTWKGQGKSVVYGNNPHHPGSETVTSAPRVRDWEFTFVVDGQDGRLFWGHSLSKTATTNEPFAWTMSGDGKTITGADTDGYYNITVQSADRIELCYAHSGLSPSKSIVATCGMFDREKK